MITYEEYYDALSRRQGSELIEVLKNTTVAICGLGGLGSHIAPALVRAGVGALILIDFDMVELSNIHRQQYKLCQIGMYKTEATAENLKEISPYVKITVCCEKITEKNAEILLQNADIICEAFDSAEAKAMLVQCCLEKFPGKYIVASSGMAGMESCNSIKTQHVMNRLYVCGDGESEVNEGVSLVSSRVMLCAAHQAHTVLRIMSKKTEV